MKTGRSTGKKITSMFLSLVLTMQAGWCLTLTAVNAADDAKGEISTEDSDRGANVYLSWSEGDGIATFSLTNGDGGLKIINDNPVYGDNKSVTVEDLASIEVGWNCQLTVETDADTDLSLGGDTSEVIVNSGCTLSIDNLTGPGLIENRGTLVFSDYKSSDYVYSYGVIHIVNNGTIAADTIDITELYAVVGGDEMPTVSYGENSVYKATSSFYKGEEDMLGKVVATSEDTFISSAGGYFTLELGSLSKSFDEPVGSIASALLYEDTTVTLTGVPASVYAGTEYDFTPHAIVAPDEYSGTPYIEYADPADPIDPTYYAPDNRPSTPGTYNARAVAPKVTGYNESVSEPVSFSIVYLPLSEVDRDGNYFTVEGVKNGIYASGDVKIVPVSGFTIDDGRTDAIDPYSSYLTYGKDDLYTDDDNFIDLGISFRREEDKAITDTVHLSELTPDLRDIVFDPDEPVIFGEEADGVETSIVNGGNIVADELRFCVADEYLDEVTVDGKTYTEADFDEEEGFVEITLNSTAGTPRDISLSATDKAGNELSLSFTLSPNPVDPDLDVTIPDDIRVGHDYEITVDTNSDGTVSIEYYKGATLLSAKPTAAGTYSVKVKVAATDLFNYADYTGSFEIWKNVGSLSVSIPSTVYVGEEYEPEITMDHDGTPVITYRYNDEEGRPEKTDKPTAAGSYMVIVKVPTTASYYEKSDYESFRIIKHDATATVSVPDTYVGESYEPELTIDSDGDVTILYADKSSGEGGDLTYTDVKPTAAGDYTVLVTVSETDTYNPTTCTDDFTISKRTSTSSVTVPDTYAGETYEPEVTTDSNGAVTVYYMNMSVTGSSYKDGKPTAAGTYSAKAVIAETDRYMEAVCYDTFTISKRSASASISVPDTTAGESYEPVIDTDSDGLSIAVVEYRSQAEGSKYSRTKPTAAGSYTARVTVPETDRYLEATATDDFTIKAIEATLTIKVDDSYVGAGFTTDITTNSDGKATVEYRASGASVYTTDKPTAPGSYVVRVTIPATSTYTACSGTAEFNINYLPAPDKVYDLTGTEGNNGFFVSDVELKAPDGYTISKSIGDGYSKSIPYSDDLNVVYLRRESDGALTSAIAVGSRPSIDKEIPSFTSSLGSIAADAVFFVKEMTLTASDDNLMSLIVNGEPVDLAVNGNILTLTPGFGIKTFIITAEDEAGNMSTLEFTLMAEWLKDRVIPASVLLPLVTKEPYNLSSGKWTVNDDKTVYNGNIPIYVNADGDYTFTQVN